MTIKEKLKKTLGEEFSYLNSTIIKMAVWFIFENSEAYKDIIAEAEVEQEPLSEQETYEYLLNLGRKVCQDEETIDFFKEQISELRARVHNKHSKSQTLQAQSITHDPVQQRNQKRKSPEISSTKEKSPEFSDQARNVKQKTDSDENLSSSLGPALEDDDKGFRYA